MNILGVDASEAACYVALKIGKTIFTRCEIAPRLHAELILTMIDSLKLEADFDLHELDCLAVTLGPGAFTGLRIAISFIQGLGFGLSKPIVGISTLSCLAYQAFGRYPSKNMLVLMDARMNQLYRGGYHASSTCIETLLTEGLGDFQETATLIEPLLSLPDAWVGVGSGWRYQHVLEEAMGSRGLIDKMLVIDSEFHCTASSLVELAAGEFKKGNICSALDIEPLYLRNEVAKPSQKLSFSQLTSIL